MLAQGVSPGYAAIRASPVGTTPPAEDSTSPTPSALLPTSQKRDVGHPRFFLFEHDPDPRYTARWLNGGI